MSIREFLWMFLAIASSALAVKSTMFAKPCPILNDLNPSVKAYIDRKMPADTCSAQSVERLRARLAVLEGRLPEVQKVAGETAELEAKRVKVEELVTEFRKSLNESRLTELQLMKSSVAGKCSGLLIQSSGAALLPPPLPVDIFNPAPVAKPSVTPPAPAAAVPAMAPPPATATPVPTPATPTPTPPTPPKPPTPKNGNPLERSKDAR